MNYRFLLYINPDYGKLWIVSPANVFSFLFTIGLFFVFNRQVFAFFLGWSVVQGDQQANHT